MEHYDKQCKKFSCFVDQKSKLLQNIPHTYRYLLRKFTHISCLRSTLKSNRISIHQHILCVCVCVCVCVLWLVERDFITI